MRKHPPYFIVCLVLFFVFAALLVHSKPAAAEMLMLSKIQNGIFHISPIPFTSETDKTDRYIDDEQAEIFIAAARAEPFLPADGNYPFSVVDHHILDTDLVIDIQPYCILFPQTRPLYLSRHNISKWDYTDRQPPNLVFKPDVHAREPFTRQVVHGVAWELYEYPVNQNEIFTRYGYMSGAEVTVSGGVAVYKTPPPPSAVSGKTGSETDNGAADSP